MWEKEKMLVTNISSFSPHNIFYPSHIKFQFMGCIYWIVWITLSLDQTKILLFGKDLKLF